MELQFYNREIPCMRSVINHTVQQELTQEIRIPDTMPEIGRVIGAWGQALLRGKQWHSSSLEASGGVMAKVLYLSEGDEQPCCVEAWVPYQIQSDFPKEDRDGKFHVSCHLRFADARSVSARKIMFRAGIATEIEAYVPQNAPVYCPDDVPDNIHVLKRTYPVCIPSELGEKAFAVDEMLTVPTACPPIKKIINCTLRPEVIDKKLLAEKIVFRGMVVLSVFYITDDGGFCNHDFEIPFSQYQELDRDYDENALLSVDIAITGLDVDVAEDGKLALKAGLLAQYVVCAQQVVQIAEDAYSTTHETVLDKQALHVDSVLDVQEEILRMDVPIQQDIMRVIDVSCCIDSTDIQHHNDSADISASCWYQVLFYGVDGTIQCATANGQVQWALPVSDEANISVKCSLSGKPQCMSAGSAISAQADVRLCAATHAAKELQMISRIRTAEALPVNPDRPGLVICRIGNMNLWDVAKKYGSSPERIMAANYMETEPESGKIIIIPMD